MCWVLDAVVDVVCLYYDSNGWQTTAKRSRKRWVYRDAVLLPELQLRNILFDNYPFNVFIALRVNDYLHTCSVLLSHPVGSCSKSLHLYVCLQLTRLQDENYSLVGKHAKHSQEMQDETIDLPNTTEVIFRLFFYRRFIISADANLLLTYHW